MKKYIYKKSRSHNYYEGEITKEMIEALPNYAGKMFSSIISELLDGVTYPDKWGVTYKDNQMTITKGKNISWSEVLEIVKNKIVYFEEREKVRRI